MLQNEKSICAIGRDMVTSGRLHAEGCAAALEALSRFRLVANGLNVENRQAVATAAARDAINGAEFIARAEKAWGGPIQILAGEDEARIAAEGVLAGIPDADGLAADLGGGSLDMVTVKGGKTSAAITLPFGPLRLMDQSKENPDKARDIVDKGLKNIGGLSAPALYAVGGIWRSFARVDMEEQNYPLHVLQHYIIPRGRALRLCKLLAGLSKDSVKKIKVVSKRRAESLPYGAVVLERLLEAGDIKDVVISAYGLREGILFRGLADEERVRDPAGGIRPRRQCARLAGARLCRRDAALDHAFVRGRRRTRRPHPRGVRLFLRCRLAAPSRRPGAGRNGAGADRALRRRLAPRPRADRGQRFFIATPADEDFPPSMGLAGLLDKDDERRALILGLAWRFCLFAVGPARPASCRITGCA